ncbi:MAG: phosphatase PAP2 family protein [Vulcanimicrobiota bacterium]
MAGELSDRETVQLRLAWYAFGFLLFFWVVRQAGYAMSWWKGEDLHLWVTWGLSAMNSAGYISIFFVFQFASRAAARERLYWLLAAICAEFWIFINRPYTWDLLTRFKAMGLGFGLVGLIAIFRSSRSKDRPHHWTYLMLVSLLTFLYPRLSDFLLSRLSAVTPRIYDPTAIRMDQLWAFSFWQSERSQLYGFLELAYVMLPLWLGVCLYVSFFKVARTSFSFLAAYLLSTGLAFLTYAALPMIGPQAFTRLSSTWDGGMAALDWSVLVTNTNARNCTPSLHVTWAILVYKCLADLGWLPRILAAIFLMATMLAIFPVGDHYLLDLGVAIPFSYGVFCLTRWERKTTRGLLALGVFWAWVLGCRFVPDWLCGHPNLTRLAELVTGLGFGAALFLPDWRPRQASDISSGATGNP